MPLPPSISKIALSVASVLFASAVFITAYEVYTSVQYDRWKTSFDNAGWLGKITVPSASSEMMWEYRPYGRKDIIATNRYGFRDIDFESTERPSNTFRVAFAGDSGTLGMGVSFDKIFVRQFELEANRITFVDRSRQQVAGYQVQALNFSVDGYNTKQIHEMVRTKALDFSPHKVVYVMHLNDFDFEWSSGSKILYFRKPRSFFLLKAEQLYQEWEGDDYHRYHFRKNSEVVFRHILAMRDKMAEAEVRFQVILLPVFTHEFSDYPVRDLHQKIAGFAERNGVSFFDLLGSFIASEKSKSHFASDVWHLNAAGHLFVAQQILPVVLLK